MCFVFLVFDLKKKKKKFKNIFIQVSFRIQWKKGISSFVKAELDLLFVDFLRLLHLLLHLADALP